MPNKSPLSLQELTSQCNTVYKSQNKSPLSPDEALNMLIENQDVVMLKFSADWCPPCKKWAPIVRSVAQENKSISVNGTTIYITIVEINIDKFKSIMKKYNIKNIPTAIYFANGKEVSRSTGALTKQETYNKLNNAAIIATTSQS